MTKQAAGSNRLFVDQYDVSGNIGALSSVEANRAQLDVTDITQAAMDRKGGLVDGSIGFNGIWDASVGASPAAVHDVFKNIRQGCIVSFFSAVTVGQPVVSLVANQTSYQAARMADGALAFTSRPRPTPAADPSGATA